MRLIPPKFSDNGFGFQGCRVSFPATTALMLDCGMTLTPLTVAYTTNGQLNSERTNAVLVCHALTGDQFVAETHPITKRPGWWQNVVGPSLPIDTNKYFVICSNILGGCMGTTGPSNINPTSGKPWATSFPIITIGDMVRAQVLLLDHLGIDRLLCVIGGSLGGMQVLQWASMYSERLWGAIAIATSARQSAQNIAFNAIGRQAIVTDPDWRNGNYIEDGVFPQNGLSIARKIGHITYVSDNRLHEKFGRRLQQSNDLLFSFASEFQIESYLDHQALTFIERFDANSYLYITRATDYFDLAAAHGGHLADAFSNKKIAYCLISFTSDWLYPPKESDSLACALKESGASVKSLVIESENGHDSFLLDEPQMFKALSDFLSELAKTNIK